MARKKAIQTDKAPKAIGPYSQAIELDSLIFLSGQIPLIPETMKVVEGGIAEQTHQVFKNLEAVARESGGSLNNALKINIFLTDLTNFTAVNEIMTQYFHEPFPARATIQVSALPKSALIEIDAVMAL
ncbi:MAG: RidA family protein [Gammaproteobacteria bacterium]|nr:RidA family protein [Gammaproteobacteria bacterium]